MLFYSFEFIYLFFPICLTGYFLLGKRSKRLSIIWLVLCSLFFYGWWNPKYVPFLIGSLVCNYYFGLLLNSSRKKSFLYLGVTLNLLLIGYYKYAGFFTSIFNDISGNSYNLGEIILPLGISFFTFQQIAWLVDSYKGRVSEKEKGIWEYGLFVTFFPQLIAGPIVHHAEMMPQFHEKNSQWLNWDNMAAGLTIFVIGLAKKVVIADSIAPYANKIFDAALNTSQQISAGEAWLGAITYSMQLYFDFSGYADMAIGLALMCNIRLPINFDSPYKSLSIAEFWRRWHITLSRFLRDYIYIPLGGSRIGEKKRYMNLLFTMLIGGLWHGAGWTFVLWGGLHGIFLIVHRLWSKTNIRLPEFVAHLLTFICVVVAWVFFRAENFASASKILIAMIDFQSFSCCSVLKIEEMTDALKYVVPIIVVVFFLPNTQNIMNNWPGGLRVYQNPFRVARVFLFSYQPTLLWSCAIIILSATSLFLLLDQSNIQEFIYFQF
ncbi:MBOAT family O-acyltransferase [Desulfopila inferna]|uniref:MBOAT family O-acyltransferase n=1 Tax=Desulfopila inferna TaxID=468528 RepID=UPI0019665C37|nr:MBOAT family protein [Desulfopila inferna]MBM9602691.1 MBOAT family protein [Desulfopila inferna]